MEGDVKVGVFRPISQVKSSRLISKTIQDTAIVTMKDE